MKIECAAEKLKSALAQAERVTGKNLSLPVLSSVLLIAEGSKITFRATNLSLGIEVSIPGKVAEPGVAAIRGDLLNTVFTTIAPATTVVLETVNDNLVIKTKHNKIVLKNYPHDDFPTLPTVAGAEITIASQKIVEGLKAVYYSAATSDIKQEIASIYIYGEQGELYFVATDSFRLAEKKIKVKKSEDFSGILIPFKNAGEIIRILSSFEDEVQIIFNKNQISFTTSGTYLTSRLIDGSFPDYKQILPKEFKTEAIVLGEDLLQALKLSNIFADKFNQITLSIAPKDKLLEVYAKNADIGENKTSLEGALSGEAVEVNLNQKYLVDCFQSITSDSISLSLNEATRPLVVRGISDPSFLYLIMPMNR